MQKLLLSTFASFVVLTAFVFLNADGQPLHIVRFPLKSQTPQLPSIEGYKLQQKRIFNAGEGNWSHGWPFGGLLRVGVYTRGKKGEPIQRVLSGPFGSYSRWPFDHAPWAHLNISAFIWNALITFVAVYCTYYYTYTLANNRFRFSIFKLLEATLVVAVLVMLRELIYDTNDILQAISMTVAFASIVIAFTQCWLIPKWIWTRVAEPSVAR